MRRTLRLDSGERSAPSVSTEKESFLSAQPLGSFLGFHLLPQTLPQSASGAVEYSPQLMTPHWHLSPHQALGAPRPVQHSLQSVTFPQGG